MSGVARARICVVTAGHLSTCPRMLKAAGALANASYRVRVVSTRHVEWAAAADVDVRRRREGAWDWTEVDYSCTAPIGRLRSAVRFRAAQSFARLLGSRHAPTSLAARGYSRVHPELVRAALAEPADLFYGGTTGALAAVAEAGHRAGVPFALDLEDFHTAEQGPGPEADLSHALAERIERAVLPDAAFLTASSSAIVAAYADKYGVHPIPVHNTFPLPSRAPSLEPGEGPSLRLYWFSQTIGTGRGLEDAVRAMGLANIPGELHLRGRAISEYTDGLRRLAAKSAPRLKVCCHEPAPPDTMVDCCRGFDAGLAVEPGFSLNNRLALSNKAFTYMLAGLAVVMTDTSGQLPLARDLGEGAIVYSPGDIEALAAGLTRWAGDKILLARAKATAWEAARRRWHWEHPEDCGALLAAVAKVLR